jgi:hypothetical protein
MALRNLPDEARAAFVEYCAAREVAEMGIVAQCQLGELFAFGSRRPGDDPHWIPVLSWRLLDRDPDQRNDVRGEDAVWFDVRVVGAEQWRTGVAEEKAAADAKAAVVAAAAKVKVDAEAKAKRKGRRAPGKDYRALDAPIIDRIEAGVKAGTFTSNTDGARSLVLEAEGDPRSDDPKIEARRQRSVVARLLGRLAERKKQGASEA